MPALTIALTVPRLTREYAPVSARASSGVPVVVGGEIVFPPGCAGLVGVRVSHRGHPLFPSDGGWITGNARTVSWDGAYLMAGPPFEILVEGYNSDDTWQHKVEVLVRVESLARVHK